jgi:hypothetical protein
MSTRATVVSIVGLILVPLAADHIPYVSPYWTVLVGAALAVAMVWAKPGSPLVELGLSRPGSVGRTLVLGIAVGFALITLNWDRAVDALASGLIFGN